MTLVIGIPDDMLIDGTTMQDLRLCLLDYPGDTDIELVIGNESVAGWTRVDDQDPHLIAELEALGFMVAPT